VGQPACEMLRTRGLELTEGGQLHQVVGWHGFYRLASFAPGAQPSLNHERPKARLPEYQRHTGAGGFARSSAIDIDVLVLGKGIEFCLQPIGFYAN
jgi:hypothetical protein